MIYNRGKDHEREVSLMLTTTNVKTEAKDLIENLKKLPKDKQEYVNGYVQGIADTIANREQQKESA